MIKNRAQLVSLELPFLDKIHRTGDAGERKRPVGDYRNRGVKFQPRIWKHTRRARSVDRQDQSSNLEKKNKRRGKGAHQRQPISRPNEHINKGNRPSQENQHFEQVRNRTTTEGVSADRQERSLQEESERNR